MVASTTKSEHGAEGGDIAPGDDKAQHENGGAHADFGSGISGYVIGLVLAGALTVASFLLAGTNVVYGPGIPIALLTLAVAQMGVHLVFFLHITTGPDNTNNVMALAFGVLIVLLVVIGSIVIVRNLNHNMTSPDAMQQMLPM